MKRAITVHRLFSPFTVASKDNDHRTAMTESFNSYFQENFGASPSFFVGTLEQAVIGASHPQSISDVCLDQ
jgi:hypothetical protein